MWRPALIILAFLLACDARPAALGSHQQRIVTLAPNITELVFALGCGDRIVGTDDFSNVPAVVGRLPKVGRMQPDLEKIAALRPDIAIGITAGAHPNLRPALAALHIPLELVRTDRMLDVPRALQRIGERLHSPATDRAIRSFQESLAGQKKKRARSPRVLFTVWADPLFAGGRETLADDLLQITGATNALDANGWKETSLESVLLSPPDIILYVDRSISRTQIVALMARGVRGEAISIDEDLFTRAGPRLPLAAAKLNSILDGWERRQMQPSHPGGSG